MKANYRIIEGDIKKVDRSWNIHREEGWEIVFEQTIRLSTGEELEVLIIEKESES